MAMGRPPKPAEQKRLAGNPGKRPLPTPLVTLPDASQGVPALPTGLKRQGKELWRRLWTLGRPWLSPDGDREILTLICQGWDDRASLRTTIRKEGFFSTGHTGQMVAHPAIAMIRSLEVQLTKWLSLCGFTPADRSRLGMAEVQRVSKLDDLIAKRQQRTTN